MVFFSKRSELSGGDRRFARDAPCETGIEEGIGLAIPESHARISLRDERLADPFDAVAVEHAEFAGIAVFGFSAHFRERCITSGGEGIWIVDECGGCGSGHRGATFCREDELQRIGEMDRSDVDDLRDRVGDFFAVETVLAVDGGTADRWILRNSTDGGDEHDFAKSSARSIARENYGGVRDDVHGRAADRVSHCRRGGEAHRRALHARRVWDAVFSWKHDFYFSRSHAIAGPAGGAGNRLERIWAVEPIWLGFS